MYVYAYVCMSVCVNAKMYAHTLMYHSSVQKIYSIFKVNRKTVKLV